MMVSNEVSMPLETEYEHAILTLRRKDSLSRLLYVLCANRWGQRQRPAQEIVEGSTERARAKTRASRGGKGRGGATSTGGRESSQAGFCAWHVSPRVNGVLLGSECCDVDVRGGVAEWLLPCDSVTNDIPTGHFAVDSHYSMLLLA